EEHSFELPVAGEEKPVPSLLRGFSAPVQLQYDYSDKDLALLAAFDTDSFNRWESMQRLGTKAVLDALAAEDLESFHVEGAFMDALRRTVQDRETEDLSLIAYALILPSESTLIPLAQPPIDPMRLHAARNRVRKLIAAETAEDLRDRYEELTPEEGEAYTIDGPNASRRRLRNVLLAYLAAPGTAEAAARCGAHFRSARGMTDKEAAFSLLCSMPDSAEAKEAVEVFLAEAKGDANVIDKWFASQARADVDDLLPRVRQLMEHPEFTLKNPNRLRSVVSVFIGSPQFHLADGSGYDFALEMIPKVDGLNPQVAAGMANCAFRTWQKLDQDRQELIRERLKALQKMSLSKDTAEIVSKTSQQFLRGLLTPALPARSVRCPPVPERRLSRCGSARRVCVFQASSPAGPGALGRRYEAPERELDELAAVLLNLVAVFRLDADVVAIVNGDELEDDGECHHGARRSWPLLFSAGLRPPAETGFWFGEFCHALAHRSTGPGHGARHSRVMQILMAQHFDDYARSVRQAPLREPCR
ncbi:unnamed protein product, partial [Effrenium voratum]